MSKIEDFKKFAINHPELSEYVRKNGDVSWQKLYELYDIYGEKEEVWNKYLSVNNESGFSIKNIVNSLKKINLDSLEENISSIQKAAAFIEEFTKPSEKNEKVKPKNEEDIERFYND